jgi:hypothetical protein
MTGLYRYIPFYTLFDILKNSHLTFVRPELWEDPFEGYLFRKNKTERGREQIKNFVLKHQNEQYYSLLNLTLENFERMFFAQSWSRSSENDAIWNTYSYDNTAIRIEMNQNYIGKLQSITAFEVVYVDELSFEEDLFRIGVKEGKTDLKEIYRYKRKAFSYEDEVRFIFEDRNQVNKLVGSVKDVPINVSEIKSVLVHPKAKKHYVCSVEQLCTTFGVKFSGKSRLYTFE